MLRVKLKANDKDKKTKSRLDMRQYFQFSSVSLFIADLIRERVSENKNRMQVVM